MLLACCILRAMARILCLLSRVRLLSLQLMVSVVKVTIVVGVTPTVHGSLPSTAFLLPCRQNFTCL